MVSRVGFLPPTNLHNLVEQAVESNVISRATGGRRLEADEAWIGKLHPGGAADLVFVGLIVTSDFVLLDLGGELVRTVLGIGPRVD
jgi:hypothetical protein